MVQCNQGAVQSKWKEQEQAKTSIGHFGYKKGRAYDSTKV